ncbi:MAG: glycoside hydrolase family 25 protein, partial [Ethanoligenens sp.]
SYFTRNRTDAYSAGVPWGPYHFLRAYSIPSAQTQADHFWQTIQGTGYSLRPVVDVETADGQQRAADIRAILQAFCDRFQQLSGEQPVIYSYTSYINEYGLAKQFGGYLLWQAQYGPVRAETGWAAQVWQYSDKGSVAGVTAPAVDLNVLYDTSVYESGQAAAAPAAPANPYPYILPVARGDYTRRAVRKSASWSARVIGHISIGDNYEIMGPTNSKGWVQVGLDGRAIGYVSAYCF